MSDRMPVERFDAELAAFLERRASDSTRVRSADAMISAIAAWPTVRAGDRARTRRLAWVAVALALALVVAAVAYVGNQRRTDLSTTPTPSALPSAPPVVAVVPSGSPDPDHHRSVTSFGTFEWTRVTSDASIYPMAAIDGEILGQDADDGWWRSADGASWRRTSAPDPDPAAFIPGSGETLIADRPDGHGTMMGASAREIYRVTWYDGPGDAAIRRKVGSTWIDVPLPTTRPPVTKGLAFHGREFDGPVALDGSNWIAPVRYLVRVPWGQVFAKDPSLPDTDPTDDGMPIWDPNTQVLKFGPLGQGSTMAPLRVRLVEGDPPSIEFRSIASGEVVHTVPATLPGWRPEALLAAFRGWGLWDVSLLVSRNGKVTVARPPWPMGEEGAITAAFGRYYATSLPIGNDYLATDIHLWESDDGLTWKSVELPRVHDGRLEYPALTGTNDRLMLTVDEADVPNTLWTTTDGASWHQIDVDASLNSDQTRTAFEVSDPIRTDFGWMMQGPYGGVRSHGRLAVSTDAESWEGIDLPPSPTDSNLANLNGLLLYGPAPVADRYATWIGRLVR